MPSMLSNSALLGLLAAVSKVSAHGFVQGIVADGTQYTGYLVNQYPYSSSPPESIGWAETATDLGFVAPSAFATGDIICHRGGVNAALSAPVAAGGTVEMEWNTWPESHKGPVIDYMANCNGDCATVDKTTLEWFKIAEKGIVDNTASPGTWASDELIANNITWSITVPSTIAAGNYVLRHEIIALHSAGSADGAQNYPQCVNLQVTGSGTDAPSGTLGTALYTSTDPGILVNIYVTSLEYDIPGPALYTGGSGSGTAASAVAVSSTVSSSIVSVATSAAQVVTTAASITSAVPTTFATSAKASASVSSTKAQATQPADEDDACEA
ncbi:Endoglucanase-4 [Lachnellula suecica]|uniref:Endoglucanase-4 n=1 Tax=Lachnellula suecica TaxID=602035 RepID=A0A8T9CCR4_9HELO|nr:Endoglucanase-4 [Lachnellula suecica]